MKAEKGFIHLVLIFIALIVPAIVGTIYIANNGNSTGRIVDAAPTLDPNCWPTSGSGFAGTLAGQPNAIWCYSGYSDGPSTAVKGSNSWIDDFNHRLSFGNFDTENYTDFPLIGTGHKSQLFRHANHWMRDVSGVDQDGPPPYDFMSSAIRPNATFVAENGQLTIEADVATRVEAYGGNLFWPEIVVTPADHPGEPFKSGAPQYQPEIRTNGTYVYETFPAYWTLGCRLQNNGGFTCAVLDDSFGGDSDARVTELSHFQCGNSPGSTYSTNYMCNSIYGGLPSNLPAEDAAYSRDCKNLDPDVNCRDRWRWEITNNRLTWYVNGKKYMEHKDFDPGAKAALDKFLTQPVYVYFGEFMYKLGKPARMHWDRIAVNPKDANGNLLPPSTAPTFCLGEPSNTCPVGGAPTVTATATPVVTPSSALTPSPKPTPTPTPTLRPSPSPSPKPTPSPSPTPKPTPSPSPTPKPTPSPSPTPLPVGNIGGTTITFEDAPGTNQALNGQYPSGLVNWGRNIWWISSPWRSFKTRSISFNNHRQKAARLAFLSPKKVLSITAYNGGYSDTIVTLVCNKTGPNKRVVLKHEDIVAISPGWSKPCNYVTIGSSNGWDTNFDDLVIQ